MITVRTADHIAHSYLALREPEIQAFIKTQSETYRSAYGLLTELFHSEWRAFQAEQKAAAS